MSHWTIILMILCLYFPAGAGCSKSPQAGSADAPVIPVSRPIVREVTDYVDFTGRTDAVEAVNVVARVTGYLVKMPFREGSEVRKGDLLFEIDPRPYQAQLDQAMAQVTLAEAQLELARANYERDLQLLNKNAISQKDFDQDKAIYDQAQATLKAYRSSTEVYKLNLEFTKVRSPIDGRISRYYLTLGNLVNQDQTLLTTLVSLDPMYVYFDMDERTLLRVRKAINEGRVKRVSNIGDIAVLMALGDEDQYRFQGKLNFLNNQVDSTTGTISTRAEFANPEPPLPEGETLRERLRYIAAGSAGLGAVALEPSPLVAIATAFIRPAGVRLLTPGMFVRVRLPLGTPHRALLVIDRALGSDQGLKYLYVLDSENKVEYRRVQTGPLQEDGLRVIEKGLSANDRVVVGALQQVRPRMRIEPEMIPMPSLEQPPEHGSDEPMKRKKTP